MKRLLAPRVTTAPQGLGASECKQSANSPHTTARHPTAHPAPTTPGTAALHGGHATRRHRLRVLWSWRSGVRIPSLTLQKWDDTDPLTRGSVIVAPALLADRDRYSGRDPCSEPGDCAVGEAYAAVRFGGAELSAEVLESVEGDLTGAAVEFLEHV